MGRCVRIMLTSLLIVSGIFIFSPSGYVAAQGIIGNPGFEDGIGEIPTAWNGTGNATRVDTGPVYLGNWTALITGDGGMFTQWLHTGNHTLSLTYDFWGWMYVSSNVSSNVSAVIAIDFWSVRGTNATQLSSTTMLSAADTSGAYVQRSANVVAPVCTNYARIRLFATDWINGAEIRFDDLGLWFITGYCFIATAAYGTETATELDILRDFRDQVLLKNALGSRFVEAYYKHSPPVANFIAKHDFLRTVVREMFVDPLVDILQLFQGLWRT